MDARDTRRRSSSTRGRSRRRRRSSSSSRASSRSPDASPRFLRRNRRPRRQESTRRSRSRSPQRTGRSHRTRRRQRSRSRSRGSRDAGRHGDTFGTAQQETRRIRRVDSANAVEGCKPRRIAPNASALKSIMLGTARSRDRMDERERARAQKKLEGLNSSTKPSTL